MIPILLKITGFLSYKQTVEVDFTSFDLACISGSNGAGKSSLLDAITWVLFGQARKRDDSLINSHPEVKAAEVIFTFSYEDQTYRIQRTLPRGKSTLLEFQIWQQAEPAGDGTWRSLSEHTVKDTQARILHVLRLDYETFINAAFFLQGKADQFAQQPAGKRKEILGNILGLELWEIYRERTNNRRKGVERDLASREGQIQEIERELSEEPERKKWLAELECRLAELAASRKLQESNLEKLKQQAASFEQQQFLVNTLEAGLLRANQNRGDLSKHLEDRKNEQDRYKKLLENQGQVEKDYSKWQNLRNDLAAWEVVADKFRGHDKDRQLLLGKLGNEQARLEQEMKALLAEQEKIKDQKASLPSMEKEFEYTRAALDVAETRLAVRNEKNEQIMLAREKQVELRSENERLKLEMKELKGRVDELAATEGANCPLCGQPLNLEDRQKLIDQLNGQGAELAARYHSNKDRQVEINPMVEKMEQELSGLVAIDKERLSYTTLLTQLTERIGSVQKTLKAWDEQGAGRLEDVSQLLEKESYLPAVRDELSDLDKRLADLGYDAVAHDAVKQAELSGRVSENDYHSLAGARAAIKPLQEEVDNLKKQIKKLDADLEAQQREMQKASDILEQSEKMSPDIDGAERALFDIQEKENRRNQDVGAARQKVAVLKDLRARKKTLNREREEMAGLIGRLKTLERAFGKDGIPALLIEQALPEIESRANELLDRLSDGAMSVRFATQSAYKDKKKDHLKETLDILISDGAGVRDYDLFSGGEAFRVNFAIRLALSQVLSHRKGARLQTLVIDEGFGSQDAQGRQRLIEAINAVRGDFAKVLVITHLDELKDAFQTRIEVTKTNVGSLVSVI
jgi:exonuclease SbcC